MFCRLMKHDIKSLFDIPEHPLTDIQYEAMAIKWLWYWLSLGEQTRIELAVKILCYTNKTLSVIVQTNTYYNHLVLYYVTPYFPKRESFS